MICSRYNKNTLFKNIFDENWSDLTPCCIDNVTNDIFVRTFTHADFRTENEKKALRVKTMGNILTIGNLQGGGGFYKVSMKNCTIKPRTAPNKIKTKFKKFLFLIYKIMKKALYSTKAEYLILPKRLGKLVEIYGKPVQTMLEYDPSKVDDKWGNVDRLFYVSGRVSEKNFSGTIYGDYDTAEKIREEKTKTAIGRVMQEKGFKIMDFEKKDARIKELEQENEELKSLPPVNVETINFDDGDIYPADDPRSKFYKGKFDEKLDENLTGNKKRGRSTWEK